MRRRERNRYEDERFDLRKALLVAVLVHLLLAGLFEWQPELLFSAPLEPPPEQEPLRFHFVDTPETPEPETVPEEAPLSDRDRRAADASDRASREEPHSEGNTSQRVLRQQAAPQVPPVAPTPPSVQRRPTPEQPAETAPETSPEGARTPEETAESRPEPEATDAPRETPTETAARETPATPELPPRKRRLSESLARLESVVRPEVYDNRDGGVGGPNGLVSFDTKGYELGPYIREILSIIERNWKSNIPPAARLPGMNGATFVRLSIERGTDPSGREVAHVVLHRTWPSGTASFDQAAKFALEISDPLPPIPEFFPYDELNGRIGFLYNLDPDNVSFPSEP